MFSSHSVWRACALPVAIIAVIAGSTPKAQADRIEMRSLDTLWPPGFKPKIEGGTPISQSCWRSMLVFKSQLGECTATIVGPRAVLTAAHCVLDGAGAMVEFSNQALEVVGCVHHGHRKKQNFYDFALCELKKPYEPAPGDEPFFENVSADPAIVKPGDKVDLVGFGCMTKTTPTGWVVSSERAGFGILNRGSGAEVLCTPAAPAGAVPGNATCGGVKLLQFPEEPVITLVNGKNIAQGTGAGGIALCQGDSGGGGYVVDGQRRTLIGVNSNRPDDGAYRSYLASTGAQTFTSWARTWSADKGGICGLDPWTKGCRKGGCSD